MKLIADENLYEPIILHLRETGHDVLSIRDSGLSGISDDEVYKRACKEKYVIITMDKDFSKIFCFPPEQCGGIILVKIYKRTVEETLKIKKALEGENITIVKTQKEREKVLETIFNKYNLTLPKNYKFNREEIHAR